MTCMTLPRPKSPNHSPPPLPQIECDLCGHRCMTQEGLDLHRLSHTGQTPLKCPVRPCRRRFISNKALEEHVLAHCQGKMGKTKGRVRFECEICFKGFAYNSTFQVHMRTHTNERPFEVRKSLKKKSYLRRSPVFRDRRGQLKSSIHGHTLPPAAAISPVLDGSHLHRVRASPAGCFLLCCTCD